MSDNKKEVNILRIYPVIPKRTLSTTHATYQNSGKPLNASMNLRNYFLPTQDQGQYGACTAFGSLEWRGALRTQAGLDWPVPSYFANYYEERKDEGEINYDIGATVTEAIAVLENYGAMPASDDPYTPEDFAKEPPNDWVPEYKLNPVQAQQINPSTLLADTLDALSNGHPVLFGFICYPEIESYQVATTGILPMPSTGEQSIGGHCVVAVGYDQSTNMLLVLNSWGSNWGIPNDPTKNGCFWMPYAYYNAYASDCWVGFADQVKGYVLTLNADQTTVMVGSSVTLTVTALDNNVGVVNQTITAKTQLADGSYLPVQTLTTDTNGMANFTVTLAAPQLVKIIATWDTPDGQTLTREADVTWVVPVYTLQATLSNTSATINQNVTMTVTTLLNGNPIGNQSITAAISKPDGTITSINGNTNSSGVYTTQFTSSVPGTVSVTVDWVYTTGNQAEQKVQCTFITPVPVQKYYLKVVNLTKARADSLMMLLKGMGYKVTEGQQAANYYLEVDNLAKIQADALTIILKGQGYTVIEAQQV